MSLTDQERKKLEREKNFLEFSLDQNFKAFMELERLLDEIREKAEKEIASAVSDILLKEFELSAKYGKEAAEETIKSFRAETSERMKKILLNMEKSKNDLLASIGEKSSEARERVERRFEEIVRSIEEREARMLEGMREEHQSLRDVQGLDAGKLLSLDERISAIVIPPPESSEDIRNKLELLSGDERLDIKFVKGWEELEKKLEEVRSRPLGRAMGPSVITPRPLNNITPTGAIDGANTAFTLPKAPTANGERVYLNGVRMRSGTGNDYTILGRVITFVTAPLTGDILLVDIDY